MVSALAAAGFDGPLRPDHGRQIWSERDDPTVRPGYGLFDRALGAAYLLGLWHAHTPPPPPPDPMPLHPTLDKPTADTRADVVAWIERDRAVAVVRTDEPDKLVEIAQALQVGGVVCFEVTMTVPNALEGIRAVTEAMRGAVLVGAGSVTDAETARRAIEAGARYVVSPVFKREVVEAAHALDAAAMPGCFTPTEIFEAHQAGADVVKVFPAGVLGPAFIAGVLAPAPPPQAHADRRRLARQRGRVAPGRRRGRRRGLGPRRRRRRGRGRLGPADGQRPAAPGLRRRRLARALEGAARPRGAAGLEDAPPTQPAPPMPTVVTFGEIMLRLATPGFSRFAQATSFDASFGGGEANVAVSLARFGHDARFVSRLPAHEIGQAAVDRLRQYGVDTGHVARGGDRVGVYFLETGASQRPSRVVYDRAHSAVAEIGPGDVDWPAALEGADWFHWTGITPALGPRPRAALGAALEAARAAGATVSCDLNFRSKLWTPDEARATMRPLMEWVDVCVANEEDADRSLGVAPEGSGAGAAEDAELDEAGYARLADKLKAEYGFDAVAITLRESHSASDNGWSAMLLGGAGRAAPARGRHPEPPLRRPGGRPGRRRRQLRGRARPRAADQGRRGRRPRVRRRRVGAEADDPRRLQPVDGRRGREARGRVRVRPRRAVTAAASPATSRPTPPDATARPRSPTPLGALTGVGVSSRARPLPAVIPASRQAGAAKAGIQSADLEAGPASRRSRPRGRAAHARPPRGDLEAGEPRPSWTGCAVASATLRTCLEGSGPALAAPSLCGRGERLARGREAATYPSQARRGGPSPPAARDTGPSGGVRRPRAGASWPDGGRPTGPARPPRGRPRPARPPRRRPLAEPRPSAFPDSCPTSSPSTPTGSSRPTPPSGPPRAPSTTTPARSPS